MPFAELISKHDAAHHLISQDKENNEAGNQALLIYIQTSLIFTIKKSKCHSFFFFEFV